MAETAIEMVEVAEPTQSPQNSQQESIMAETAIEMVGIAEPTQSPRNFQQESDSEALCNSSRNAHRVFRRMETRETVKAWLNPFRHIPWDVDSPKNTHVEAQERRTSIQPEEDEFRLPLLRISFKYMSPERPFTKWNQFKRTFLTSWINIFLLLVPVGICLYYVQGSSAASFAINLVAEIPLWFLCDYALEEMEKYIGPTASDILDIVTNNTVQVISSVLLLQANKVQLLQTSLVGSILSNILVLLGVSLVLGGMMNHQQEFNRVGAQGSSSLLSIAATSLMIPTAVKLLGQTTSENLIKQSRGVAVLLLLLYVIYTLCQMVTHKNLYKDSGKNEPANSQAIEGSAPADKPSKWNFSKVLGGNSPNGATQKENNGESDGSVAERAAQPKMTKPASSATEDLKLFHSRWDRRAAIAKRSKKDNNEREVLGPQLRFDVAALLFAVTITLLYFCIAGTVDSISALTDETSLSQTFVALILLPIPNCDFAPITMAVDDYMEQTMKYTVGRSIQTAFLLEPIVILMAWGMGVPDVSLAFDGFEVISLFTTILLLNFLVIPAKVHWVHGVLLLFDWVLIAIAAFFVTPEIGFEGV